MFNYKKIVKKVCTHINGNYVTLNNMKHEDYCNFAHHCEIKNTTIDKRSFIGRYTKIENSEIGRYCSISWNCTIGAPTHPIDKLTSNAFTYRK